MSTRDSWESLWDERVRTLAENDALKLRVAVMEKALAVPAAEVLGRLERDWCIEGDYAPDGDDDNRHPVERRLCGMAAMHRHDVVRLERALEEVSRKAHEANNRCQAVVCVCESTINYMRHNGFQAERYGAALEEALGEDGGRVLAALVSAAAQAERAAIIRKIRQDARIAEGLASFSGNYSTQHALCGLADDLEAGAREQTGDCDE